MTARMFVLAAIVATASLVACGEKQDPKQSGLPDASGPVSWCDVGPVITTVCTQCHSVNVHGEDRNGAPVEINFDTYDDMLDNIERAAVNIQAGTMPPDDIGLPQGDRDLIRWWIEQATPACATGI